MYKKLISVLVLMFLMAIAIPVLAQRYDSCERRGRGNAYGHQKQRYDRGRNVRYYRQDYGRRNRRSNYSYGGNYGGYYAPAYYPQTYYAPSYYTIRRRPVRRIYNNYSYRPRYRRANRGQISFSIGF